MTIKQTEQLLRLLAAHGVVYFKTTEVELRLEAVAGAPAPLPQRAPDATQHTQPDAVKAPPHASEAPPRAIAIPHHENAVTSLLKLSDTDLVDALFPDHTNRPEE